MHLYTKEEHGINTNISISNKKHIHDYKEEEKGKSLIINQSTYSICTFVTMFVFFIFPEKVKVMEKGALA